MSKHTFAADIKAAFGTQHHYSFPSGKEYFFISFKSDEEKRKVLYSPPSVRDTTFKSYVVPSPGAGKLPGYPIHFSRFNEASSQDIVEYLNNLVGDGNVSVQRLENTYAIVDIKEVELRRQLILKESLPAMTNGAYPRIEITNAEGPYKAYVTNIHYDILDHQLRDYLWSMGHEEVTQVEIVRDTTDRSCGFGFVRVCTLDAGLDLLDAFHSKSLVLEGKVMRAAAARESPVIRRDYKPRQQRPTQQPIPQLPPGYNAWRTSSASTSHQSETVVMHSESPLEKDSSAASVQIGSLSTADKSGFTLAQLPTAEVQAPAYTTSPVEVTQVQQKLDALIKRVEELQQVLSDLAGRAGVSLPALMTAAKGPFRIPEDQRQDIIRQLQDEFRQELIGEERQKAKQGQKHQCWQQVAQREVEAQVNYTQSRTVSKQQRSSYIRMEVPKSGLPSHLPKTPRQQPAVQVQTQQQTAMLERDESQDQFFDKEEVQQLESEQSSQQNLAALTQTTNINTSQSAIE
jgi:hypothetical protein